MRVLVGVGVTYRTSPKAPYCKTGNFPIITLALGHSISEVDVRGIVLVVKRLSLYVVLTASSYFLSAIVNGHNQVPLVYVFGGPVHSVNFVKVNVLFTNLAGLDVVLADY
ncbi:hypothetical protein DGG96_03620 [Legionella qingyii]|uniref:Uncharacterized protein n=1 Tax=Legionella qingyii TaxID=2184757 RepID=A0A317U8R3_9GAMM|nr:hypothetical protein DGG96_03620 [Legionella qingyii]